MNKKTLNSNSRLNIFDLIYLALITAFTGVCYKLFYRMCVSETYESDFTWYINLPTSQYKERHRLLGFLFDLMYRHGIRIPGMVLYLALVIAGIILMSYVYLKFFTAGSGVNRAVLELASLLVLFMGPIYVPGFHEYYYRWSFQTFAWHSPTEQSMILYSIIAMLCFIKMYEESEEKVNRKWWLATMLTSLFCAFAKPSFIIDLIPAMILLFLIDLFTPSGESFGHKLGRLVIMGTSLIPAGVYMLAVMKYSFNGEGDLHEGSVIIDIQHVIDYPNLTGAIVCGLAFPIVVWLVNIKLLKEKRYRAVAALFVMGVIQWSLLYEEGERAAHGNFAWGRQAGCFFFFLTSVAIAINNWKDKQFLSEKPLLRKAYFALIGLLLIMHVASQLRYFYLICMGHKYLI